MVHEGGKWRALKVADFEQPVFVVGESDGGMLVVTGNAVYSMDRGGAANKIHSGKWWGRTPVSMSAAGQGEQILLGMDGVVVVLRKTSNARYDEKWYARPSCS